MHAMNSVFVTFEIVATKTRPLPIAHLGIMLVIMSLYLGIAYLTKVTEGIFVYLWLNPKNGVAKLLLHMVGYTFLLIGFYVFVRCVIAFRCRLLDPKPAVVVEPMDDEKVDFSSRESFWTYEQYEEAMVQEEKEKQLRWSVTELPRPEPAVCRTPENWPFPANESAYESGNASPDSYRSEFREYSPANMV